jgi:hypothetical protein
MSFKVRHSWKYASHPPQPDSGIVENYNHEDVRKILDTVKNYQRVGPQNSLSSSQLNEVLRKSSINPDINPNVKDSIDQMLKNKDNGNHYHYEDISFNGAGFSNRSIQHVVNASHRKVYEAGLKKELDNLKEEKYANENTNNTDESNSDESDEKKDKDLESIENAKSRKRISNSYPIVASMSRGFVHRQGGLLGGIKRTPTGICDAF